MLMNIVCHLTCMQVAKYDLNVEKVCSFLRMAEIQGRNLQER
jgi:hypothetical protein